jgi:hypothetical protein
MLRRNFLHVFYQKLLRMNLSTQIIMLFILAIPIAVVAWTVTHEEVFVEIREFCRKKSMNGKSLLQRKFFYIFTCEYCFSFYVTALFLLITNFQMLYVDWRGYLVSGLALVWIANIYMSLFFRVRIDIKKKGTEAKLEQKELEEGE